MKTTFKVSYYLRSNYENKEGKSPVMLRMYLGGEMANLGSTKIFVDKSKWSNKTSRMIGRTAEALSVNASIDALTTTLMQIYRKYETSESLSLDLIRSVFLGTDKEFTTFLPIFDKYIDSITQQVGKTLTKGTLYKYKVVRQNFEDFLQEKYHRKDIGLTELTSAVVQDFELYLTSVVGGVHNTTTKKLRNLKTVINYARNRGLIMHDPFANHKLHYELVDRGYLTEEEVLRIMKKRFEIERLELVRNIFIFSCFTGLAYIDVYNLTYDKIVTVENRQWLITKRYKTSIDENVILLDIPLAIIRKYYDIDRKGGKVFPMMSNQRLNSYLKEIADLCGIKKNLTFHMARHTFATTICLENGLPIETVSKMLGHRFISTTELYAKVSKSKIAREMKPLMGSNTTRELQKGLRVCPPRKPSGGQATFPLTAKQPSLNINAK